MKYIAELDQQLYRISKLDMDETMLHSVQTLRSDIRYIHICTMETREKRQLLLATFVTSAIATIGAPYLIYIIFPRKPAIAYPDARSDERIHHIVANTANFVDQAIGLLTRMTYVHRKSSRFNR